MTGISTRIVAERLKRGKTVWDIAKEFDVSVNAINTYRRWAMAENLIDRPVFAYGRNRLNNMINKRQVQRGTISQILSLLDDDEIELLLSRLGKRKSLHHVIVEIIQNEARRDSGYSEILCDEGSGGNSR